ncbi:hypothetical protein VOLCADRAFT_100573 [Volvox carteri f. nagariensis]|uniref:Uncharacterized protein n=1 Tax=Volvox carteri f. nagariensis TaxID=3068 RepID=D8UKI8_VOLCA|nr:uncharacterized protein VOLCADRAFT_100573 [Volvox carteri f. nagariensis]EFJ39765.1 hypothetical protein VOLCADRAFT_100573 [Volvox carteri f. nagariensis]|eukprot:XP_002959175.1 hypothetical protein VOLCADRAFT_100573 [Volvox carteri f. nagariensis]
MQLAAANGGTLRKKPLLQSATCGSEAVLAAAAVRYMRLGGCSGSCSSPLHAARRLFWQLQQSATCGSEAVLAAAAVRYMRLGGCSGSCSSPLHAARRLFWQLQQSATCGSEAVLAAAAGTLRLLHLDDGGNGAVGTGRVRVHALDKSHSGDQ